MLAQLWPTCSTSTPLRTTNSPSTWASTPGTSGAVRGCFSPRKFSITRVESFTETFMGKWAATAFIFASKPTVTPAIRFLTWLSHVWRSACACRRFAGSRSTSLTLPAVTPAGTGTVTRSLRASVDIGEEPPSDLELPGLGVAHDAPVGRKDQETEVLRRQEPRLVPLEGAPPDREPGLDDAAGVDPAREGDLELPAPAGADEGEVLDVLVLPEDPEDLADQVGGGGQLDLPLPVPVRVAEGHEGVVERIVLHGSPTGTF